MFLGSHNQKKKRKPKNNINGIDWYINTRQAQLKLTQLRLVRLGLRRKPCENSEVLWMRGYGVNIGALSGSMGPCLYRAIRAIAVAYTSDVAAG